MTDRLYPKDRRRRPLASGAFVVHGAPCRLRRSSRASMSSRPRSAISRDVTLRALSMPGRRGRDPRRGHARLAHAARPLRDRTRRSRPITSTTPPSARPRRAQAHGGGSGAGAHLRRRHAADFRSRLQARRRGGRRRASRSTRGAGRLRGARGALRRGPADRPLLFRGLPAAEERRAPRAAECARRRPRHARLLRIAGPARRDARRPCARTRRRGPRRWRAN